MKKAGAIPLVFFALFWSAITGLFDVMMVRDAIARFSSLSFEPVSCVVLESKVAEHSDSEGSSYAAEIRYRYSIDGTEYQSDRVYAGTRNSTGSGRAHRLVVRYPSGSVTNAYFNPNQPGVAVLRRGFLGNELFHALFMTPFNLIMVGLWTWIVGAWRTSKSPPIAGGAKLMRTADGLRVRLPTMSRLIAAGVALGGVSFISIFIVGFTKGEYAPPSIIGTIWGVAITAAIAAYVWRGRRERSGREDLVLHADGKRVTLPQTFGRSLCATIARDDITGLDISVEYDSYKRPSQFIPTLVMRNGERLQLAKWSNEDRANRFNEWLREELQLPPPKLSSKPV